jgi:tight adherence protein C
METAFFWASTCVAAAAVFVAVRWLVERIRGAALHAAPEGPGWMREFALQPLGRRMEAALPAPGRAWLERAIREAALRSEWSAAELLAAGSLGSLTSGLAAAWTMGSVAFGALAFLLVGATGLHFLRLAARQRQLRIAHELPYVLDLLTLVLEGGHDLTTGLAETSRHLPPGPLGEELSLALRELRLGRPRAETFRQLGLRAGSKDLQRLTSTLARADGLGAPLGPALRALSGQLRSERFLLAEERAGQAPVKMLLPLALFIFPAVFLVLLGPIAFALIVR